MPGLQSMLIGGVICVIGLVITIGTMSSGDTGVVAYGAIIVGGLQFIVGLFQYIGYATSSSDKKDALKTEAGLRAVVRGMLVVAAADGELEIEEVGVIKAVSERLFGQSLSTDQIVASFNEIQAERDYDITKEFRESKGLIDTEFAELAILSMAMVAMSDGDFDRAEARTISSLAGYLNIPKSRETEILNRAQGIMADEDGDGRGDGLDTLDTDDLSDEGVQA